MSTRSPQDEPEWAELAAVLPDPGQRELPPGRHLHHRAKLMAAIERDTAPAPRRAVARWRPALAFGAVAIVLAGGIVAGGVLADRGSGVVIGAPSPSDTLGTSEDPGPAKIRGFGTVAELTAAADLVVRGTVAGSDRPVRLRVDEVLLARDGLRVVAGAEIGLDMSLSERLGMSALAAGQQVVVYLARGDDGVYRPLSGDFGIFDVTGDTATARSSTMSVSGLRTPDPAAPQRRFSASLDELRELAGP
ncbi:hypothetical protein F4553_002405 [Allocatelliglobosispora scoriae]|uniref:Uncharacterized protein n=1 Tax=Allocatelliglobosispora scoriae TaxID=643052 RepID=A0A841BNZ7_9ACTN|nr:hypothetical protein [Allocatelliglobosispora scoriae]MBB5869026.1 hypothetical protein [Allocatelliglobosispora scoriae]